MMAGAAIAREREAGTGATVHATLAVATARLAGAGIPTARQDAELLLARVLGTRRLDLHVEPGMPVPTGSGVALDRLVTRRLGHEPLQYLLGEAEFRGLTLEVGPGVFVPRPETEALVERGLAALSTRTAVGAPASGAPPSPAPGARGPAVAIDLCTGSGAVACALAAGDSALRVWAVEREAAPLRFARANVERLHLEGRVTVLAGDLFAPLAGLELRARVDLVTANPPYLARPTLAALPPEVRDWEPRAALDGGPDGTVVVGRILGAAPGWLAPGGTLLMEIGEDQGNWARARAAQDPRYRAITVHRDFRGAARVLEARRV